MLTKEQIAQEIRETLIEINQKGVISEILERGVAFGISIGVNNGWYGFTFGKKEKGVNRDIYEREPKYPVRQDAVTVGMGVLSLIKSASDKGLLKKLNHNPSQ